LDSYFGRDLKVLDGLPKELTYFVDIPSNHLVYIDCPELEVEQYTGRKQFISPVNVDSPSSRMNDIHGWRQFLVPAPKV
jgi:hypothetical protein